MADASTFAFLFLAWRPLRAVGHRPTGWQVVSEAAWGPCIVRLVLLAS